MFPDLNVLLLKLSKSVSISCTNSGVYMASEGKLSHLTAIFKMAAIVELKVRAANVTFILIELFFKLK